MTTAKIILKNKNKVGGLSPFNFKVYYKTIAIKIVWNWQKYRQVDQWDRTEKKTQCYWFSIAVEKQLNGESFLRNDNETTLTYTLHHIQKLTWNRL